MSARSSLPPVTPFDVTPNESRRPLIQYNPDVALAISAFKLETCLATVAMSDESPFRDESEEAEELIDMSVRILPGVRNLIDSLPADKYAVATSGAKTYCYGCLSRTGYVMDTQSCLIPTDADPPASRSPMFASPPMMPAFFEGNHFLTLSFSLQLIWASIRLVP